MLYCNVYWHLFFSILLTAFCHFLNKRICIQFISEFTHKRLAIDVNVRRRSKACRWINSRIDRRTACGGSDGDASLRDYQLLCRCVRGH